MMGQKSCVIKDAIQRSSTPFRQTSDKTQVSLLYKGREGRDRERECVKMTSPERDVDWGMAKRSRAVLTWMNGACLAVQSLTADSRDAPRSQSGGPFRLQHGSLNREHYYLF